MSKKIKLIIGSTRQGRVGITIAKWLVNTAKDAGVELEVIDLKKLNLPFFDGRSPAYFGPQTDVAKAWSAQIIEADAIVFVTAEYNRSIPAPLKNSLDYLFKEWNNKPAAIVSYGYIDAGASVTKHLIDVLSWLKMKVVEPKVAIALSQDSFKDGVLKESVFADAKAPFLAALEAIDKA